MFQKKNSLPSDDASAFLRRVPDGRNPAGMEIVNPEEVELSVRNKIKGRPHPVVPPTDGLFVSLTKGFTLPNISPEMVDRTGRSPKIVFVSKVSIDLRGSSQNRSKDVFTHNDRYINLAVGIPERASIDVTPGAGYLYTDPAIMVAEFLVEGSWNEKKGQATFYNKLAPVNGCAATAAAFQMAYYYTNCVLIPELTGRAARVYFQPVPLDPANMAPGYDISVFLPHELRERVPSEVLTVITHACEARDIMVQCGYPLVQRVWNSTGNLPGVNFTLKIFWEAFHTLAFACCANGSKKQFECDFLLAIAQMFPLHGNCSEGGIYRSVFKGFVVEPNRLVVLSCGTKLTCGYENVLPMMVITAAMTLQTVVSRTLYESNIEQSLLTLAPGITNNSAHSVIMANICEIKNNMAQATQLNPSYFDHYLGTDVLTSAISDRHISDHNVNVFGQFSGFIPSYSLDIYGDRLGQHFAVEKGSNFLEFKGPHEIEMVLIDHHQYYDIPLNDKPTFRDGSMFLHPSLNKDNGLSTMVYESSYLSNDNGDVQNITMTDGRLLSSGDLYGTVLWPDNGDIVVSLQSGKSLEIGKHYFSGWDVPDYAQSGTHTIGFSRYTPVYKQKGEITNGNDSKRITNSRWLRFLQLKNYNVMSEEALLGGRSTERMTVFDFHRKIKKQTLYKANQYASIDAKHKARFGDEIEEIINEGVPGMKLGGVGEDKIKNFVQGNLHGLIRASMIIDIVKEMLTDNAVDGDENIVNWGSALAMLSKDMLFKPRSFGYFNRRQIDEVLTKNRQAKKRSGETGQRLEKTELGQYIYGLAPTPREFDVDVYLYELSQHLIEIEGMYLNSLKQFEEVIIGSLDRKEISYSLDTKGYEVQTYNKACELAKQSFFYNRDLSSGSDDLAPDMPKSSFYTQRVKGSAIAKQSALNKSFDIELAKRENAEERLRRDAVIEAETEIAKVLKDRDDKEAINAFIYTLNKRDDSIGSTGANSFSKKVLPTAKEFSMMKINDLDSMMDLIVSEGSASVTAGDFGSETEGNTIQDRIMKSENLNKLSNELSKSLELFDNPGEKGQRPKEEVERMVAIRRKLQFIGNEIEDEQAQIKILADTVYDKERSSSLEVSSDYTKEGGSYIERINNPNVDNQSNNV